MVSDISLISSSNSLFNIAMNDNGDCFTSNGDISKALINQIPLSGSYSIAMQLDSKTIFLSRDPIGTQKLFYFFDSITKKLYVSNSFLHLGKKFGFKDIYSVPRGGYVLFKNDKAKKYKSSPLSNLNIFDLELIKNRLQFFFSFLKNSNKKPIVCLSGGLDSTLIAFLASQKFSNLEVITAVFAEKKNLINDHEKYNDFFHAQKIAKYIGVKLHPVFIEKRKISEDLPKILRACQDWRDYNVHCAVLNYYIAEYVSKNFNSKDCLILTGDLMNEIFADYTSEIIDNEEFYKQPKASHKTRQRFFINGLDSSDREIGVFSSFGLQCIQPYAFVLEYYRSLTNDDLSKKNSKYFVNGNLIPKDLLDLVGQSKMRAQVGDDEGGILGYFIRNEMKESYLRKKFCELFDCSEEFIDNFIQIGSYKTKCVE